MRSPPSSQSEFTTMEIELLDLNNVVRTKTRRPSKSVASTLPATPTTAAGLSRSPSPHRHEDHADESHADLTTSNVQVELAPIDGGSRAWIFLIGAFICELICLGGAFSFSIFQDYLVQNPKSPLRNSSNVGVSAIGTMLVCTSYFAPACFRGLWARFPQWNRTMGFVCLQLAGVSLIVASFGTDLAFLLVFMGLFPGILLGLGVLNYLIWLPQWFLKRRGLANGIAFAGAGTGGILYPFILSTALHSIGFQWTLRIWAGLVMLVGGLASLLVRPRIPVRLAVQSRNANAALTTDSTAALRTSQADHDRTTGFVAQIKRSTKVLAFTASPLSILNALATFVASMSFFSVSFYLAVYCTSIGIDEKTSTGIVAAFNAAALTGEIIIGHACDRFAYPGIIFGIGAMGSLSAFLLFGLAQSLVGVIFFVLLYGMAAGSWCSVWTPAAYDISRLHNMQTANVILFLTVPRGLASAVGPLVAAKLYHPEDNTAKAIFGAFGFDGLIVFVGTCMAVLLPFAPLLSYFRRKALSSADPDSLQERLQ